MLWQSFPSRCEEKLLSVCGGWVLKERKEGWMEERQCTVVRRQKKTVECKEREVKKNSRG